MIHYKDNIIPTAKQVAELYKNAGLNRPTDDVPRIQRMLDHSNLIITAWKGYELVGISRALSDFSYCCYLSDLAVKKDYQSKGIGKELVRLTKGKAGEQSMLLLLAATDAENYYPKIGMEKHERAFITNREE